MVLCNTADAKHLVVISLTALENEISSTQILGLNQRLAPLKGNLL